MSFLKTELKRFPENSERISSEARYWKKFKQPATHALAGKVTCIHFQQDQFAVSSGARVTLFDDNLESKRVYSRFSSEAFSGTIRGDGKLMVAGDASGLVQVFELASRTILRSFTGHKDSVHVSLWDENKIFSASDDRTVRGWDLPTQAQTNYYTGHTDYIRCGLVLRSSSNWNGLWATGSYDGTVKIWDNRMPEGCVATLSHLSPLHSLVETNSGLVSAGDDGIRVWDTCSLKSTNFISSGKSVTSLAWDSHSNRLISGGLDSMVCFYSPNFELMHNIKYDASVLSVGISPSGNILAVGLSDGTLVCKKRTITEHAEVDKKAVTSNEDFKVEHIRKAKLRPYDTLLKKFCYADALDSALESRHPVVIVSLLYELIYRDCLVPAISNRDETSLEPIIRFILRYITNPHYEILIQVMHTILDCYGVACSDLLVVALNRRLKEEEKLGVQLLKLQGALDMIIATAQLRPFINAIARVEKRKLDEN